MTGRVVVIGGSGFVGRFVLAELQRRGADVHCIAHQTSLPRVPSEWTIEYSALERWSGQSVDHGDTVVDLARLHTGRSRALHRVNVDGTRRVAGIARRRGARLIALSSTDVYGTGPHRRAGVDELDEAPVGPVARTHALGDAAILGAGGLVLRPHLIVGADDPGVGSHLAMITRAGGLVDGGHALHTVVHVTRLADVIATLALDETHAVRGVLLCGEPVGVPLRSVLEQASELPLPTRSLSLDEALSATRGDGDPEWAARVRAMANEQTFDVSQFAGLLSHGRSPAAETRATPRSLPVTPIPVVADPELAGPTTLVDERIVDELLARIASGRLALGVDEVVRAELVGSVHTVLRDVHDRLGITRPPHVDSQSPYEIGRRRAEQGVHPKLSIDAAATLFDIALPHLSGLHRAAGPGAVAGALHHVITNRVSEASVSYVNALLDTVSRAQLDERRRVAREMHDVIAHEIGVGLILLELHLLSRTDLPDGIRDELLLVRDRLRAAADDVRGLASTLRDVVGDRELGEAIDDYIEAVAPPELEVEATVDVDVRRVPSYVREQVYLVTREAVRNALLHAAGMTRLTVAVVGHGDVVVASVTDDGCGFETGTAGPVSTGLASMRERAAAVRGELSVITAPGRGTTVSMRVSLGASAGV